MTDGRATALLARNADALVRSASRPLIRRMADGTVTGRAYTTYLAIEQSFVRTAARLLGYCVWQEPDWDAAVVHAGALAALVGEQTDYFAARVTPLVVLPPGADALEQVVTDAVLDGGYPAVVTCLCAAETLYSRWCTAALATSDGELRGRAAEWIALHTTPAFTAQAAFLQSLVDRISPTVFPDAELDRWFVRMLAAEDTFHDAALTEGATHD
jgi:thiaminase/transcriptional activator TenA